MTIMSPQFPKVPKAGIINVQSKQGTKQYVTKEGLYSVAYTVSREHPYRIEYDVKNETLNGVEVAVCRGRLYKTTLSDEKTVAWGTINRLIEGNHNKPDIEAKMLEIINKPDIEDIAVKPIPVSVDGKKADPKEIEILHKKLITNCKMRILSEFTGAGYAIPGDYTDEDIEDASPEQQAAAIASGLEEITAIDAKTEKEWTKDEYLRAIGELCIRDLKLRDMKNEFFKRLGITRNSQLTDEQTKELYDGLITLKEEETVSEFGDPRDE